MSALDIQVGGNHYKGFNIQPVEFIEANGLSFLQGCIIKRTCRYDLPTGKGIEDLKKVCHEAELLMLLKFVEDELDKCPVETDWDGFLAWCRGENPGYGEENDQTCT